MYTHVHMARGVGGGRVQEAERALSQVFYGHEIQWLSMPLHDTGLRATPYSEFPDPIRPEASQPYCGLSSLALIFNVLPTIIA